MCAADVKGSDGELRVKGAWCLRWPACVGGGSRAASSQRHRNRNLVSYLASRDCSPPDCCMPSAPACLPAYLRGLPTSPAAAQARSSSGSRNLAIKFLRVRDAAVACDTATWTRRGKGLRWRCLPMVGVYAGHDSTWPHPPYPGVYAGHDSTWPHPPYPGVYAGHDSTWPHPPTPRAQPLPAVSALW